MGLIVILVAAVLITATLYFFAPKWVGQLALKIGPCFAVLVLVTSCFTTAPTGTIKIARLFGNVVQNTFIPDVGLQLVNPLYSLKNVDVTQQTIEPTDNGQEIRTGTSDDNFLTVDALMSYKTNRQTAWKLESLLPLYKEMMAKQAASALRQGVSEHAWTQTVKDSKGTVAKSIGDAWEAAVKQQLVIAGFTDIEAENAFTFFPVRLKKAVPDDLVLQSIARRSAATEDEKTQNTLTTIASDIAERRKEEGKGMSNLIKAVMGLGPDSPMPKLSANDIAVLLNAISTQERATAMLKIAEDPKRPVTAVMIGDAAAPPVTVGGTQQLTPEAAPVAAAPAARAGK
jgi:regulator of protease activity HflC (stomatin/prohibitin superfamily)